MKQYKNTSVSLKTLAMKARVFNQIRTDIYKKHSQENIQTKYYKEEILTQEQKLELFEKWFVMAKESHTELLLYKNKRKRIAKRDLLREQNKAA